MQTDKNLGNNLLIPRCRGKLIHRQKDRWGEILVLENENQRVMTFDRIFEQSKQDINNPLQPVHDYTKAMLLVFAFINPEKITLLGLGGGCLARAIHAVIPHLEMTIVELRQAVTHITRDYFGLPDSGIYTLHIEDAEHYLASHDDTNTDIIFSDLYDAYQMNSLQGQIHFLKACHRSLAKNGWLVLNFHTLPDFNSDYFAYMRCIFDIILVCPVVKGNHIVFAGKSGLKKALDTYRTNLQAFQTLLPADLDLLYRKLVNLNHYNQSAPCL